MLDCLGNEETGIYTSVIRSVKLISLAFVSPFPLIPFFVCFGRVTLKTFNLFFKEPGIIYGTVTTYYADEAPYYLMPLVRKVALVFNAFLLSADRAGKFVIVIYNNRIVSI